MAFKIIYSLLGLMVLLAIGLVSAIPSAYASQLACYERSSEEFGDQLCLVTMHGSDESVIQFAAAAGQSVRFYQQMTDNVEMVVYGPDKRLIVRFDPGTIPAMYAFTTPETSDAYFVVIRNDTTDAASYTVVFD